jgi:ABC-type transporter Mla subunit MlaD
MSDPGPGLSDLFLLLGNNNPLSSMMRTMTQFQKGVDEFLIAVENMNRTLETLNGTAARVNGLLDTVEEPIKAFVPQVTRTIKTTDKLVEQLSAVQISKQVSDMMSVMNELIRRMAPLAQFAESAGGMFGIPGLRNRAPAVAPAPPEPPVTKAPAKKQAPAKKKAPAKKAAAKKK